MNKQFHFFHIDSFAFSTYRGNPAGVIVLDDADWPEDRVMQEVAAEINLPVTAFIIPDEIKTKIRWFSPLVEVQLCGHAGLAAGAVLLQRLYPHLNEMIFSSKFRGELPIKKIGDSIQMNFPRIATYEEESPTSIPASWQVIQAYGGEFPIFELASQKAVQHFDFDRDLIKTLDPFKVVITAKSADPHYDFVSRVFEPNLGLDEDAVTGSAHCALADLWSKKLGKTKLKAAQLSKRMGELDLETLENRVLIAGQVQYILEGKVKFPEQQEIMVSATMSS